MTAYSRVGPQCLLLSVMQGDSEYVGHRASPVSRHSARLITLISCTVFHTGFPTLDPLHLTCGDCVPSHGSTASVVVYLIHS